MLYDAGGPLVDFTLVIICPTDDSFNTLRQEQAQKDVNTVITSKSGFTITENPWMFPGMKAYLFNWDTGLIRIEDALQDHMKKKNMQLDTSEELCFFFWKKKPTYIIVYNSQIVILRVKL